jgi:peptidoglycan hydrolase-like protein with peptidoglycan-binding domain
MIAQSVPELTDYQYNDLYYNSAGTLITGNFMYEVCDLIDKCGIDITVTDVYDDNVANAVSQFQQTVGLNATGVLTTSTLQAMLVYAKKMNDIVEGEDEAGDGTVEILSTSPHYNSFFDDDNFKMHRRNHKDIKIVFGNKSITKTIKDVYMRSVSVEVDTSGNPVSEIYEFIARDIVESDEIADINKYTDIESYASSDIKHYDYSAIGIK